MSAIAIGALLALLALAGCGQDERPEAASAPAAPPVLRAPAAFVGREACASCHPEEAARWRGSHHDLAMQEAGAESLLGDFDGAQITHFGVTTTFSRREGRFFANTDGPDGALREYEVAYAFGVEPLQQVLIRLPGGRLQALGVAWDAGRRRWFHLYPDEPVPHGDVLHWTGPNQNWNGMCAECHSTGLRKGYRPAEDRYETTWAEIDVSCEACHGPGSAHVAWAEAGAAAGDGTRGLLVPLRNEAAWVFDEGAPIARRTGPAASDAELDACGRCHARRGLLREEYLWGRPLLDTHRPALLDEGLYHADGQILDEVYVWGSFLQSRMHAAGVVCSDCHDPHGLRIEGAPDAACARCHRPEAFATPAHHHHAPGTPGASCVECHMPAHTYMVVDPRRDHSLRVPRPDLGARLGTPDACSGCHAGRGADWAARAAARWWPARAALPHWAEALHAGRARLPGAERALAALAGDAAQPAVVRATALRLLRDADPPPPREALERAAGDAEPLVRMAAAEASEALEPQGRLAVAKPLLRDPLLGVRLEAARVLAGVPAGLWSPGERAALADALAEYRAAQMANAERPEAHLNLGVLHAVFGEIDQARTEYQTALRLAPWFVPAWVDLADLERQAGREAEAEAVLWRALETAPDEPALHHALGLALVRQKRLAEALDALGRAAAGAPERARYAYVFGVALHTAGQTRRALEVLAEAQRRHPGDRELLAALATLSRDAGDAEAARRYARELVALAPGDPGAQHLLAELEAGP